MQSRTSTVSPAAIVIAGPAGVGKTTVGLALARALDWEFLDADALHSAASVEKMRSGINLTDDDRRPWLGSVKQAIQERIVANSPVVIACSALREDYRDFLTDGLPGVVIVVLDAPRELLEKRLENRDGHFAGTSLLDGQLAAFECPRNDLIIDATRTPDQIVAEIRTLLF